MQIKKCPITPPECTWYLAIILKKCKCRKSNKNQRIALFYFNPLRTCVQRSPLSGKQNTSASTHWDGNNSGNHTKRAGVGKGMSKTASRFKQILNAIHIIALMGSLLIALPVSAILQETRGCTMKGSALFSSCASPSMAGETSTRGKMPAKPCPILQLRVELVLRSEEHTSELQSQR